MKKLREAAGKGPDGQRATLSELDLLVGDVLYFNHRVSKLLILLISILYKRGRLTRLFIDYFNGVLKAKSKRAGTAGFDLLSRQRVGGREGVYV